MMIRVTNGRVIWPYSLGQLRQDEPTRSFSSSPSDTELAWFGVYRVQPTTQPSACDPATHRVVEVHPIEQDGTWRQAWEAVPLTDAEKEAYYRATHPPQWIQFGNAVTALAEINQMLAAALAAAPAMAMALPVGLGKAADGDSRVFLSAWQAGRSAGLIPAALVEHIQQLGRAHDLPPEFIAGLGDAPWQWPEDPQRGDEWTAPDGSVWRFDQPRNEAGQFLADDPATEAVESALKWLEVTA